MGYGRRRRSGYRYGGGGARTSRAPDAAIRHVQAYRELASRLGPIVDDVRAAFFKLPPSALEKLFCMYESRHGRAAGAYARDTFENWRSGQRQLSGQTAERLLDLVPRFLSVGERYEIVRKLCAHNTPRLSRDLKLQIDGTSNAIAAVKTAVSEFSQGSPLKAIPEHVLSTVQWLNNDDVTAARAVLAEVDAKMAQRIREVALVELARVERHIQSGDITSSTHTMTLPNGTLRISFERPGLLTRIVRGLFS